MDNVMRTMPSMGNSFDKTNVSFGHAKKVWREVREVLPSGGTINGVKELFKAGTKVIKAGTPVKFDELNKTIDLVSMTAVEGASGAAGISALGINGFLYRDIPLESENTIATGDVVVNGDIYYYAFSENAEKVLKQLPQSNGLKIRIVY